MRLSNEMRRDAVPYIVIEGPDGVGKSSLKDALWDLLYDKDILAYKTREPGSHWDVGCHDIRDIIMDAKNLDPTAEFLLFAADRMQHQRVGIPAMLDQGAQVILGSRGQLSTWVYQNPSQDVTGIKGSLFTSMSQELHKGPCVALTVLLDASDELLDKRLEARDENDRFDQASRERQMLWRQSYRQVADSANKDPIYGTSRAYAASPVCDGSLVFPFEVKEGESPEQLARILLLCLRQIFTELDVCAPFRELCKQQV